MKGTWKLHLRMWIASILMFTLLFILLSIIGTAVGLGGSWLFFLGITIFITIIQFLAGPKLVEMSMRVHRVSEAEAPELHRMVEELSQAAGIPKPKVGISDTSVPNAFAYGRSKRDGHIAVTRGILGILTPEELKAVLGHEMSHINHNDSAITTIISTLPMICYYIAWGTLFSGGDDNGWGAILGALGFVFYFIGQLVVLFISRVREYYADQGSVELGCKPEHLASALYKLVYGAANSSKEDIKAVEGSKAFFLNDVSSAGNDISELSQIDLNKDGVIGADELEYLRNNPVKISTSSKFMEVLSTHPDMVKRVKRLSELQENMYNN